MAFLNTGTGLTSFLHTKMKLRTFSAYLSLFIKSFLSVILVICIGYFVYKDKGTIFNLPTEITNVLNNEMFSQTGPCQTPLQYTIGTLDPRFGITASEIKKDIKQASDIWGKPIGKTLFEYNPNGNLTINLVYDRRQQITQKENILETTINRTEQTADSVKQEYTSLQKSYQQAQQEYTAQQIQYQTNLQNYNSTVNYWNSSGGVPDAERSALTVEQNDLLDQQNLLEQKRQQANQFAEAINALIDKYNLLVDHVNSNVSAINNDGLTGTKFEEGEYISDASGKRINIFQFQNQTYFIRVLAHELGHALQLGHNSNPQSIMNPINISHSLALSPDDLQELKAECGLKK